MTGAAPRIAWISPDDPPEVFPPLESAFSEPDGLLAAGGDLSPDRLLYAYQHGIFPWYDEGQPILWWSPDPRCVLFPDELHVAKRLRRSLRQSRFVVTFNSAFDDVIAACAEPREGQSGTWITADMNRAYADLHRRGWAHSIEIWRDGALAGGIYGLAIDRVFFGESMFSRVDNASKAALLVLCREMIRKDFALLDCQVMSPHLLSLGAKMVARDFFAETLGSYCVAKTQRNPAGRHPVEITEYLGY